VMISGEKFTLTFDKVKGRITSLTFILVDVPEPVWNTSTTN
jgi:hypothetical protein